MARIRQDFGLRGVPLCPFPFLLEGVVEAVGVLETLDVTTSARVPIPVPRAPNVGAGLEDLDVEPEHPQPVEGVHAAESGADDNRVDVGGRGLRRHIVGRRILHEVRK